MDLNCAVIYDLLPLYLEGLCSEETKILVETHLADCQSCQETYRRMAEGTLPEPAAPEVKKPKNKPLNAKKVLKRIRRRWIALLLCALLIVPVTILSLNQADGTGLSFTSIPYVIKTREFLSTVAAGNYNKAFSLLDVTREYNSYATPLYQDFSEHPFAQYHKTELAGESYYVSDSVYRNQYAAYLEDGDEAQFWLNLLLFYESRQDFPLMIPETIMPAIKQKIENDQGLYETLAYFLSRFSLIEGEAGSYYIDCNVSEDTFISSEPYFCVLPAYYYSQSVQYAKQTIEEMNKFSAGYAALGLEKYTKLSQEVFTKNLEFLAQKGIIITDWRLTDIYVMEDGIYHITYALKVMVNGQSVNGSSVEFTISKNGIINSSFQESNQLVIREETNSSLLNLNLIRFYFLEYDK